MKSMIDDVALALEAYVAHWEALGEVMGLLVRTQAFGAKLSELVKTLMCSCIQVDPLALPAPGAVV